MARNEPEYELAQDFSEAESSLDLARILLRRREEISASAKDMSGIAAMHAYSNLTDSFISAIFNLAVEETRSAITPLSRKRGLKGIAIAAVGGYGRREMSPFSDIDVAFIAGFEEDAESDQLVKRAFRLLMDALEIANLKVGYSYRRLDDVNNLPLETQTALLDARYIAGNELIFHHFKTALHNSISPAAFVLGHIESRKTAAANQDTPFSVEPNVKEGPGGLRDLHAARWIADLAFRLPPDKVWEGLRGLGIISDAELKSILEASEFISRTRNALHLITGRGHDILNPEKHFDTAEWMGFKNVEDFVASYYKSAHDIWTIYNIVTNAALSAKLEIEPGISAQDGKLFITDKGIFNRDETGLMRVFQHAQSFNLVFDHESADLIRNAARDAKLTPDLGHLFLDILSRKGASAALRSMSEMGVLSVVIPRFADLMYLVPSDAAHYFTVGEHSLRTVENLEDLLACDEEQFTDVFSRIQNFEVLFLAALLHDMGKLFSKKDHARTGAIRAANIATQLGMNAESCEKVEFLIRHHLKMSETARLRDLNRQKTIKDFTAIVNDLQLLDMLLLLTVADYRAVGSRNWSEVQIRFLMELHERASAALRLPDSACADIERHRARVQRELRLANLPSDEVDEHCNSMPPSYLLNTPPNELAAHIGFVKSVRNGNPVVEIKDDRTGRFTQITIAVYDRPGLLSDIAGVVHALNIDIHAAQIYTRLSKDNIAIDFLYVDFEGRQLAEMKKCQLEGDLLSVLKGDIGVSDLLRRWGKEIKPDLSGLSITILDNMSDHETVLEVRGEDMPGLLYQLTKRISELGYDIHSARVATWGHEARDVFYITNRSGNKLSAAEMERLPKLLTEA